MKNWTPYLKSWLFFSKKHNVSMSFTLRQGFELQTEMVTGWLLKAFCGWLNTIHQNHDWLVMKWILYFASENINNVGSNKWKFCLCGIQICMSNFQQCSLTIFFKRWIRFLTAYNPQNSINDDIWAALNKVSEWRWHQNQCPPLDLFLSVQ